MKRHVKASSAGSTLGGGNDLALLGGAGATRGGSCDAEGSGASISRARVAVVAFALAALTMLGFASLSQARVVVNGFGGEGTLGGQFGGQYLDVFGPEVKGVAVNNSGAGGVPAGTSYVVDGGQGANRIQRFSPSGAFERTWGQNVAGRDERQTIAVTNMSGGSFTLSFGAETTSSITPFVNSNGDISEFSTSEVESALASLPSIGFGNIKVTGSTGSLSGPGPYTATYKVRFLGALSGTDVPQISADDSALTGPGVNTGPPSVDVTTTEPGSGGNNTGFEICTVAANCQEGIGFTFNSNGGGFANAEGIAVSQTNGHVYVSDQFNRRIQEFDADGNFVRAFGWDVQEAAGEGFEICTVATECKSGAGGSGAGQFGAAIGYPTVDSSGNLWVPDQTNKRVQVFDSSGNFVKMLGGDVITNGAEGTGDLANGSTEVTNLATTEKFFEVGQTVTAASGLQAGTTITEVTGTSLTLSKPAEETLAGQTLTAAPGAGNSSANETQTITVGAGVTGGKFNLTFNGQTTGASSGATVTRGSNVITNVANPAGFEVGQGIFGGFFAGIPRGTTITAVGADTLTISNIALSISPTVNTTVTAQDLALDSSAATVQTRLEGLSNIAPGDIAVSGPNGGPWTVEFQGPRYGGTDVPALEASSENLTPEGEQTPQGTVVVTSANPFEVCSAAAQCRGGAAGNGPGQFSGNAPGDLAFDSSGNLYALDAGSKRAQKFNSSLSSVSDFGAAAFAPLTAGNVAPQRLTAVQGGSRLAFSVPNVAASDERQILELDTAGALQETSLAGSGVNHIGGLAANDTAGTVLATTDSSLSPRRVMVLGAPLPDPVLAINPVVAKTDTTASFSGTVDPQGGLVSCTFEYSTDQTTWSEVKVPGCDSLNPSGGAQAVSANVTELIPGKQYFVRLVVTRPLVAGSAETSSVESFLADGAVPVVTNTGALSIEDTSARIAAAIDPRNSATSYVIEYGTSPALGSSTTAVNIGSGSSPQLISQVITGLTPSTTYHYKVVATNLVGGGSSAIKTFTTRAEPQPLPGGRAYEMVSPADKNGGSALSGYQTAIAAHDGEAVGFCTTSIFAEGQQSWLCADYVSHRGDTGWKTKAAAPRYCRVQFDATAGDTAALQDSQRVYYSRNLEASALFQPENDDCPLPQLVPGAPTPQKNIYRQDLLGDSPNYQLLAPVATPGSFFSPQTQATGAFYMGGDDDLSHVVYLSQGQQTPDGPTGFFATGLYEWDEGTLRVVGKDPSGNAFFSSTVPDESLNGISGDGERIYFEASFPTEVFMREGGTVTHDVSQSECTSSCGADATDIFMYGAEDGSRALIKSGAKLTDDDNSVGTFDSSSLSNADLFLYTHSATPATDTNLTLLSKDNEPADGSGAEVIGVQGISDDASVVYFVARGQIVPGGPTAPGPKLYRWDLNGGSPTIEYLATLNTDEGIENWAYNPGGIANRMVTPDGEYVLAGTRVKLDPAADTDTDLDAYRWDSEGGWVCTTCQEPGQASAGDTSLRYFQLNGDLEVPRSKQRRIVMSDDGQRVFFNSRDALVPGDVNGEGGCPTVVTLLGIPGGYLCQDAYEWHDGTTSLLTTGTSKMPAAGMLLGASADGRDVFIFTDEKLVGWDTDTAGDIYDVRIGGGFPEPPPTGAPCEGESCRGATPAPPAQSGAGTAAFEGPGNQPAKETKPRSCPAGKKKVTKNRKTRCVKQSKGKKKQSAKKKSAKRDANNDRRTAR